MRMSVRRSLAATVAIAAAGALVTAGCSARGDSTASGAGGGAALTVDAAFYPLQFVADRVAGDYGAVTSLTAPGIEPHDLELSPATVRSMQNADVVLYIGGLQPAVDDAITSTGVRSFDAADAVPLVERQTGDLAFDPHFWLAPALLAKYTLAVGDEFAHLDPAHADAYMTNAAALSDQLNALDAEFTAGLATCTRHDIVTNHEAFGYLADAYGLHQESIAGLDPEAEPSAARLREIKDLITTTGATTVFTESLASTRSTQALADDAGVATAVLNPIESVPKGDDYESVMKANLATLRTALDCH